MEKIRKICLGIALLGAIFSIAFGLAPAEAKAAEELASGTCGESLTWTLDADGVLTISGTGAMTDYENEEGNGYVSRPWDQVTNEDGEVVATGKTTIKKVVIESGVTSIGKYAFLRLTNLTSVTIPSTVTTIGFFSFERCTSLADVTIPESVETIESFAFYGCTALKSIDIPNASLSQSRCTFRDSGLITVHIGSGVTSLGEGEIYFGDIFFDCDSLEAFTVDAGNETYSAVDGVLFNKDQTALLSYPAAKSDASYDIPDSVETIYCFAFFKCSELEELDISSSVKKLVSSILYNPSKLKKVTIPASVENFYTNAICECANSLEIYFKGSAPTIKKVDYTGFSLTADAYYPAGDTTWTDEVKQVFADVGATITWHEYTYESGDNTTEAESTETKGEDKKDEETVTAINRFSYSFANTKTAFGYSTEDTTETIYEESLFTRLWGDTATAKQYYNYWTETVKTWPGNCYGISTTSSMLRDVRDDITLSGFREDATLPKQLTLTDFNSGENIQMSLQDLIECMQVSQVDEKISYIIGRANKGKLARLCTAVSSAQEDDTSVIIVLDSSGTQGAHALVGYALETVSDTESRICVYDCNHPNEERYLTLTMEDGTPTGWSYDGSTDTQSLIWSSEESSASCTISYISYDSFIKVWLNRDLDAASSGNVMTTNTKNAQISDAEGNVVAVLEDGEITSDNDEIFEYYPVCATADGAYDKTDIDPLIYLPTGEYTVTNTDKTVSRLTLSMSNGNLMASVTTTASSVLVNVNESIQSNLLEIVGDDSENASVSASFYSTDSDNTYKTISLVGSVAGTGSATLGASVGGKIITNFDVTSETVENKDEEDSGENKDEEDSKDSGENKNGEDSKDSEEEKNSDEQEQNSQKQSGIPAFTIASATGSKKIAAGKKCRLTLQTLDGKTLNRKKFSYRSSNTKLATVTKNGVVKVKKSAGGKTVTITATAKNGKTAKIKLRIMKQAVKKIKVTGKKKCKAGKNIRLKAKVTAKKGANKKVIWISSNTRYAKVTKKGVVKAKKAGKGKKVTITAVATDGSGKKGTIKIKIY